MATKRYVRWNAQKQKWMGWVRFPDGSRRKAERIDQAAAQADFDKLLAERDTLGAAPEKRTAAATFGDVLEAWFDAGCPTVRAEEGSRARHMSTKSGNTIDQARSLIDTWVKPKLGSLRIDRTSLTTVQKTFEDMAHAGKATATIYRTWFHLNTALAYGVRFGRSNTNPATNVMLPEAQPAKQRKAIQLDQVQHLLECAIPSDQRPAMWLTGLMCGLRPGEIIGLRWCHLDIDSPSPWLAVREQAAFRNKKYVGQILPKKDSQRTMTLHPLLVAALQRHRDEQQLLGQYVIDDTPMTSTGFVFCTRSGTPYSQSNVRRYMQDLFERADLGKGWTTYELRHSFVSLADNALEDLQKVADIVGHVNTKTTMGYRHTVQHALPYAADAWARLLDRSTAPAESA